MPHPSQARPVACAGVVCIIDDVLLRNISVDELAVLAKCILAAKEHYASEPKHHDPLWRVWMRSNHWDTAPQDVRTCMQQHKEVFEKLHTTLQSNNPSPDPPDAIKDAAKVGCKR